MPAALATMTAPRPSNWYLRAVDKNGRGLLPMILSDHALDTLEDTSRSLSSRLATFFGFSRRSTQMTEPESAVALSMITDIDEMGNLELPNILDLNTFRLAVQPESELTGDQRRARATALRGFTQARSGDFAAAHASFVAAVQLDNTLDLIRLPDFSRLPREAHVAAIAAYEDAGEPARAAQLTAQIRSLFKLRLLPEPEPVRRTSAGS